MAASYTTPGVYIVEKNAFPNSVVQVETAIPAFVGFTAKASYNGKNLTNIPTRVDSLKEFEDYFGRGFLQTFRLTVAPATAPAAASTDPLVQALKLSLASDTINTYQLSPAAAAAAATAADKGADAAKAAAAYTATTEAKALITAQATQAAAAAANTKAQADKADADATATRTAAAKTAADAKVTNAGNNATPADKDAQATADAADTAAQTAKTAADAAATKATTDLATATTAVTTAKTAADGTQAATDLTTANTAVDAAAKTAATAPADQLHYLYNSIRLFYLNGGSTCYIVSVGDYTVTPTADMFTDGIKTLIYEQDPTMLLCPDALQLDNGSYNTVMTSMLAHCADTQSRVALFDLRDGAVLKTTDIQDKVDNFRNGVGQNFLNYGNAYFPWVNTSVISPTDASFINLDYGSLVTLRKLLNPTAQDNPNRPTSFVEVVVPALPPAPTAGATAPASPLPPQNIFDQAIALLSSNALATPLNAPANYNPLQALADKRQAIDNSLQTLYSDYKLLMKAVTNYQNTLPVAPAMAGVYTAVDSSVGVWKAPANWSLNGVVSPTVSLSDKDQGRLNVDAVTGKSINVIRAFRGMGTLVWGARTLDGNSQDWRYISVRRTMIMIEQSVKLAAHAYVFEPNDANTWTTVKSAINSFLFNLWKQGALAGAAPADAFQVLVGLGTTMTADDILDGYMNVTVLVALVHPAEFIELTFQQQQQKS